MAENIEAQIRVAEPADGWALRQLLVAAYTAKNTNSLAKVTLVGENRDIVLPLLENKRLGSMLVVEVDDELVGTVSLFAPAAAGGDIWRHHACGLRYLAVAPHRRKSGLSAALLSAAERQAIDLGASGICVHLPYGTPGLIELFTARGYQRDPGGDVDRGSALYWDGYFLALSGAIRTAASSSDQAESL